MWKNYFRVTVRHLLNRKIFAFINITGLAIGIACCLLILIYIFRELSYDTFHDQRDRIYRVVQTYASESREDAGASTPFRTGPRLESEYPHLVKHSVRFYNLQADKLTLENENQEKLFKEPNFFFADSTVFDVFSFVLTRGNPETALTNPQSLIISEEMVEKYFGDEDPIGKELFFEGRIYLTVTGVLKKIPSNSHIPIDFLASFNTLDEFYKSAYDQSWYWNPCWTYILLNDDADVAELKDQLPLFTDKYYHPNIPEGERVEMDLQPLTDIHLRSHLDQEIRANGDIKYVYIFSAVAVLILAVASINFMNLSTAKSASRSSEVGMRKALGASRGNLFWQFLGESFLMCFLAILLSLLLLNLMLPFFNDLLNVSLSLQLFENEIIMAVLLAIFVIVGFTSGIYPAVFLSRYNPVNTLRGIILKSKKGQLFRKSLVVLQFTFSIILIIGTIVVYQQVNYMQDKKLGFDKEQIVIIPTDLTRTIWFYEDFKQELEKSSDIEKVTGVKNILGSLKNIYSQYTPEGYGSPQSLPSIMVMHDFVETYNIEMAAGRSFSKEYETDRTQAVMINEKMVEHLDWESPQEALGKSFKYDEQVHQVVGVTENFNHTSLRRELEPLVIDMPDEDYGIVSNIEYIAVRINGENIRPALDYMDKTWKEFDTSHPFEYFFHDERLDRIYQREKAMGSITASFSVLCIIVACLGLFGLASYSTEIRQKEIGIRKTLGAPVSKIVALLTKDYLMLVLVANVIAWPIAYYLSQNWLKEFPYRIDFGIESWMIFAGSGLLALLISVITISYQSIKAALINPAETIRDH